jgi:hypothetical protein
VRVAFATTTEEILDGGDTDRVLHDAAFARAGIGLDHCVWWDSSVAWDAYDLIVIRSPWDYVERFEEFLAWLLRLDPLGTLRNPAGLVAWNLDKRYLAELAAGGVPVIPTRFVTSREELLTAVGSASGEIVVKPVVSAGSRMTGRFRADDPRATTLGERILDRGLTVMVQPAVRSVATEGETSAVLFDGVVSHSFRKGPILDLGGGLLGDRYLEQVEPRSMSLHQQEVVAAAWQWVAAEAERRFGATPPVLYARVDLVTLDDGTDVVLEIELAEPSFFLDIDPPAADRFAAAVRGQIEGTTASPLTS